jgi:histone deacetylase 1/2
MLVYVDDMLITGSFEKEINAIINHLLKVFPTKLLDDLNYFLGMEIRRSNEGMHISQTKYIVDVLRNFDWMELNHATLLCPPQKNLKKKMVFY